MDDVDATFESYCPVCEEERDFEESDVAGENYQIVCTYCYCIWPDTDSLNDEINAKLKALRKEVAGSEAERRAQVATVLPEWDDKDEIPF